MKVNRKQELHTNIEVHGGYIPNGFQMHRHVQWDFIESIVELSSWYLQLSQWQIVPRWVHGQIPWENLQKVTIIDA